MGRTGSTRARAAAASDDVRALWDTVERLWAQAAERAGRLPAAALDQQVTDAWASRTVLDEERPFRPLGLPPR